MLIYIGIKMGTGLGDKKMWTVQIVGDSLWRFCIEIKHKLKTAFYSYILESVHVLRECVGYLE